MIYLFIFMYLLICVILYDVYERKLHLRANYIVLYFLFTLIAGLRWRLGVDTVNYMNFFQYEMPPLSQLSIEYITESRYQPFWLLLNAVCLEDVDTTVLRKSFFLSQLCPMSRITYTERADFLVDGKYRIAVCGEGEGQKFDSSLVVMEDMIERGKGNIMPLWLAGFTY